MRAPLHLKLVRSAPEQLGLSTVYARYSSYVAAVVFRLLGHDDEIDDIIQEVFLVAVRNLHALREHEAVKGWLATIAVRLSTRRLRRRRLRIFFGLDTVTESDIVATREDPADRVLLARVYSVLDDVPAAHRVAWILHHVEGETLPEVARMCDCSLATVKRRISAAQLEVEARLK